jgi:DNA-binding NtrC family response regulator
MDLTIPGGMGGKDAIKEILKIDPDAKAIVSSGYSNDPVMANYHQHGFKASLGKPFEMAQLKEIINVLLG